MIQSQSKSNSFYCRRDNCIVNGCPLGPQLARCPLRLYCQAWREVVAAPAMATPPSSHDRIAERMAATRKSLS